MATYENIGTHAVLGHAPGEIFEADIDFVTEARLASGGHLKRVTASANAGDVPARPLKLAFSASSSGTSQKNDAEPPDADDDVAA